MKKYFGLSVREEMVLRYLNFAEQWLNIIGLLALNGVVISTAVAHTSEYSFDHITDFIRGIDKEGKKSSNKIYSKIIVWASTAWLITKTSVYFARRYLDSKVVAGHSSTEGIEKR